MAALRQEVWLVLWVVHLFHCFFHCSNLSTHTSLPLREHSIRITNSTKF